MANHSVDQIASIAERNSHFYSPLPTPTAIRLICLDPSCDDEDVINCHLDVVPELQSAPQFEALSYCWGAGGRAKEVRCNNDAACLVSENLFFALRRLRLRDRKRLMWIDAMCINQHDLLERGQQVSIMRMIYAQSSGVVVWLGELDGAFESTIRFMHEIAQDVLGKAGEIHDERTCAEVLRELLVQEKVRLLRTWVPSASLPDFSESCWEDLARFFELPWLYRVWVIQEIQSCEAAQVLCGSDSIDWIIVDLVSRWFAGSANGQNILQRLKRQDNDNQGAFMGTEQLYFMRVTHLSTPQEVPFLRLLDRAQSFRSSNPRDKIYALLTHPASRKTQPGTTANGEASSTTIPARHLDLTIEYSMDLVELLRQVTLRSITQYNTLETLNYAWKVRRELFSAYDHLSEHSPPAAQDGYPSWVPQWDAVIGNRRAHFRAYMYDASSEMKPEVQLGTESNQIFLRGIKIDVVSETNITLPTRSILESGLLPSRSTSKMSREDYLVNLSILLVQDDSHHTAGLRLDSEGLHHRASQDILQHFANFAAYLIELLKGRRKSMFLSSFLVTCHVCYKSLTVMQAYEKVQTAWNCCICHMGAFDICNDCYEDGKRCLIEKHQIKERNLQGFWFDYDEVSWERFEREAVVGKADEFRMAAAQAADRRAPVRTERGLVGICPFVVVPGDVVVVLFGGRTPFVLRKVEDHYQLIAECYMHGLMDGEMIEMWQAGLIQAEQFDLR